MEAKIILNNEEDTKKLAKKFAKSKFKNMIVCLDGDLGSGKTFFSKSFAKEIGINEAVTSPTFTIIKEYEGKTPFYHIDVYRLNGDVEGIGLEEYFDKGGIVFIEWSSMIKNFLPKERIEIDIKRISETKRELTITSYGDKYDRLLGEVL